MVCKGASVKLKTSGHSLTNGYVYEPYLCIGPDNEYCENWEGFSVKSTPKQQEQQSKPMKPNLKVRYAASSQFHRFRKADSNHYIASRCSLLHTV